MNDIDIKNMVVGFVESYKEGSITKSVLRGKAGNFIKMCRKVREETIKNVLKIISNKKNSIFNRCHPGGMLPNTYGLLEELEKNLKEMKM